MPEVVKGTSEKPSPPGWYWHREPRFNMDKRMPVWVYDSYRLFYANLLAVHSEPVVKNVRDCQGEWAGPMEMPS